MAKKRKPSRLGLASVDHNESGNSILMWEMNVSKDETGIAGGKSLDIKPFNRFYFPLASWKNDELLMKDAHNGMLSYNVRSRKLRKPPGYVKSLVFIKGKRQTFFLL